MIELKFPFCPVTVNTYYRRGQYSTYLSARGKEFKENMINHLLHILKYKQKLIVDRIRVSIEIQFKEKRKRDVDNYNKAILDSFNKIIWEDDEQIDELNTKKSYGNKVNNIILKIEKI